jgi:hypothetical protein
MRYLYAVIRTRKRNYLTQNRAMVHDWVGPVVIALATSTHVKRAEAFKSYGSP